MFHNNRFYVTKFNTLFFSYTFPSKILTFL
jgi:hypothetical protein